MEGRMRVLITGATGFIGARLVSRLLKSSHELRCLVRKSSRTRILEDQGVPLVQGDVTDKASLVGAMAGCDWVANLANLFDFWVPDRRQYEAVNVVGTKNVIEAASEARVSKVLHVSTVAVFGDAAWPVTENSSLGPNCPSRYAQSKREGDALAWELSEKAGVPLVMVYPAGVIGPDDPKAAGRYIRNFLMGKLPAQVFISSTFPWVYVDDAAEVIARALEKNGNEGERYFAAAENLTFGQINRMLTELSGVRAPRLIMPDWLTMMNAHLMTALADVTKRPPLLDMAVDQMRLMKQGMEVDGSKAVRELGVTYTPIRRVLREIVQHIHPPKAA
jgi:dihydroflavonol-4-reductase